MVWGAFIVCVIIASVILFMIETLPEYTEDPPLVFFILESIIIGIFTFELLVRFLTTPSYIQFIKGKKRSPFHFHSTENFVPKGLTSFLFTNQGR